MQNGRNGSLDAGACRECLTHLLTEESESLNQLEGLLQREHEVLAAGNVAAIERTALMRQQMMGALARTEEQRRTLCSMHGYAPDWVGLEQFMRWCDPQGSLMPHLRECAQRALRCRDLNERNGTLVAARLKHVEGRLSVLMGNGSGAVTYGPKGTAPMPLPKRELGAA